MERAARLGGFGTGGLCAWVGHQRFVGSGWALEKEPHAIDNSFTERLGSQPVDNFDPNYF